MTAAAAVNTRSESSMVVLIPVMRMSCKKSRILLSNAALRNSSRLLVEQHMRLQDIFDCLRLRDAGRLFLF